MAAYSGHAESLDALLKKGADYEAVDKNDKTAVYLAAEEDKLDALKVKCCRYGYGGYSKQAGS